MKKTTRQWKVALGLSALVAVPAMVSAADWPIWGRDLTRNMITDEKNLPVEWAPGEFKGNTEEIDLPTTKNVKWVVKLGSQSYGNPTVAGGKVYIGTNNATPRNAKYQGDRSNVYCFDEKTGKFLWELSSPKLGSGKVNDWEFLGVCSTPAVDGNRVYFVTNRCEVVCLDTEGLANGNDGLQDEGQYLAGPGKPALKVDPTDADVIWRYDMIKDAGVFPHNACSSSPLIVGDKLFVATANGVDNNHVDLPAPRAPAFIMLDKKTGELLGEEAAGISARTMHSNWSSATYGKVGALDQIFFGGGDGWTYAFTPETKDDNGIKILNEAWRFDCNPPQYRVKNGKPLKYATHDGPSEIIATPVFYKNRVYVPIGQDPEHGEGLGNLVCIDPTKSGDITKTGAIWQYDKIARTISTPSIADGLVYVADFSGFVHCVDAETGKPQWVFDTKSHIWGSTLVGDGKVYVGTEDGDVVILQAGRTMKELGRIDMRTPVYSSPVMSNGTMYLMTTTHLYAIGK